MRWLMRGFFGRIGWVAATVLLGLVAAALGGQAPF